MDRIDEINRKAANAEKLRNDPIFKEALKELQDNAISAFSVATATQEQIMAAHEKIKAAQTFLWVLDGWTSDKAYEDNRKESSAPQ